jgi:RNA polymerase sigma-70 factor (ECF subfamily)
MVRVGTRSSFLIPPGGGETVRAFTIFAGLLAVLVWATHAVAFQDMSQLAKRYRMLRASQEAQQVAQEVTSLGRGPAGMDFFRLRKDRATLEKLLSQRLADHTDLKYVAVRDRFGAPVTTVAATPDPIASGILTATAGLVVDGTPQGEVRVGLSTEAIDRDIGLLRRSLRTKVVLVAALGVCLLAVGLFYSLHLIRKNRELEDLLQDAFIEIFRALPSFRGDSTLGRWCQTIAVRVAYLTISRRQPPTVALSLVEDVVANDVDVRHHVQAREAARRLYAVLDRIEVKQRIAFALSVIDGKPLAEVAELTESTLFAVKTRVWRARRELTLPPVRFHTLASTRPSTAPLAASTARTACSRRPRTPPPLPTGP